MTTRITIDSDADSVTVHVTDDTGRDDTRTMPRYPKAGSETYLAWVDTLDRMMAGYDE